MEKISVVGLDGSGKSSALEILVKQHLKGKEVRVVDPSAALYASEVWKTGHVPIGRRVAAFVDRTTLLGDKLDSRLFQGAIYGAIMGVGSHPFYWLMAAKYHPDLLIRERDVAIDGAVYSQFYFPFAARVLTASQRLWLITEVLQHSLPRKVIYLDVEPEVALDRILKSLEEKAWTGRKNMPHPHENLDGLRLLRGAYHDVLEAAEDRGIEVVRLDATSSAPEQVASAIYSHILPHAYSNDKGNGTVHSLNGNGNSPKKILVVK